jgi:hypothetical protein
MTILTSALYDLVQRPPTRRTDAFGNAPSSALHVNIATDSTGTVGRHHGGLTAIAAFLLSPTPARFGHG